MQGLRQTQRIAVLKPVTGPSVLWCLQDTATGGVDKWSRCDGNQIELDAPSSPTEVVTSPSQLSLTGDYTH